MNRHDELSGMALKGGAQRETHCHSLWGRGVVSNSDGPTGSSNQGEHGTELEGSLHPF